MTFLDCDDIHIRAICTFDEQSILIGLKSGRNGIVPVDDCSIHIRQNARNSRGFQLRELQAKLVL